MKDVVAVITFLVIWATVVLVTPGERPVVELSSGQVLTPTAYGQRVQRQLVSDGYRDLCVRHLDHVYHVVYSVGIPPDDLTRWVQATEIIAICRAATSAMGAPS